MSIAFLQFPAAEQQNWSLTVLWTGGNVSIELDQTISEWLCVCLWERKAGSKCVILDEKLQQTACMCAEKGVLKTLLMGAWYTWESFSTQGF